MPRVRRFGITLTRFAVYTVDLTQAPCERALLAVLNFAATQYWCIDVSDHAEFAD
jgi:hypothetical protein